MEVLDPSVSRDDQPLCVNDSLERGNAYSLVERVCNVVTRYPSRVIARCSLPRARKVDVARRIVWKQRDDQRGATRRRGTDVREYRENENDLFYGRSYDALSFPFPLLGKRHANTSHFILYQLSYVRAFFALPFRKK